MSGRYPDRSLPTRRAWLLGAGAIAIGAASHAAAAVTAGSVRVGVLPYGSARWEIDVIRRHGFDIAEGVAAEPVELASDQASDTAILGGSLDIVVSDWLWVSRQRAAGADLTTIPYSAAVGALMVAAASDIADIGGLRGRKLGVAGGPLDKSWLLLQALAGSRHGTDLTKDASVSYGAAPLLTEKLRQGELDAVLDYWQFAARLEAEGYRRLIGVEDIIAALGVPTRVPQLVYTFSERWANERPALALGFARASARAKAVMRDDDDEWDRLRPLMGNPDDRAFELMRRRFREGIVPAWGPAEQAAAETLYGILASAGGEALVGSSTRLSPGTFWASRGD
ncbi:MAG: ABC transporter substrate-binding protein [Geminicoccaceae bacterium]